MNQLQYHEHADTDSFSQAKALQDLGQPEPEAEPKPVANQPEAGESKVDVVIQMLTGVPERTKGRMPSIMAMKSKKHPISEDPDWHVRALTDSRDPVQYTPMNTSAEAKFDTGYLGTDKINGCVAAVAAYRDEHDDFNAWLGHYDAENVREKGEAGNLKFTELLATFAGEHPVKVAIAYPKAWSLPPTIDGATVDAGEIMSGGIPIDELVEACKQLPAGSEIALIPYETSKAEIIDGHTLYVGRTASGRIDFGWDGHKLEVGKAERPDERRATANQAMAAADEKELRAEHGGPRDNELS